jgi:cytochrome c oxidase cbb3-type subunit 3
MGVTRLTGVILSLATLSWGQGVPAPSKDAKSNPLAGDAKAARQGAVLFREGCVPCHGVGARGGLRGPDLTSGNWAHGGSDAELARTIGTGLPGTAMPDSHLTENEAWEIITYLRTLQQPPAPQKGDARRGEELFFGTAKCSSCHIVKGRGGLLGPELTQAGSARSRQYLIESIREPSRQFTENHSFGDVAMLNYDTVTAVTREGKTIVGVGMNEDTFTVQIMDTAEHLYSLDKKTLKSLHHDKRSLMPAYGVDTINESQLEDLLAYLQSLRAPTPAREKGASDAH